MRYGTKACTVQCRCTKCGKDDHSTEHHDIYSDVQERRAARGAKAMAATSTQSDAPPKGKLKWRVCPKGFKQRDGLDYDADDIHAPVMDKTSDKRRDRRHLARLSSLQGRPEIQLQARFFGVALDNGELVAQGRWQNRHRTFTRIPP